MPFVHLPICHMKADHALDTIRGVREGPESIDSIETFKSWLKVERVAHESLRHS